MSSTQLDQASCSLTNDDAGGSSAAETAFVVDSDEAAASPCCSVSSPKSCGFSETFVDDSNVEGALITDRLRLGVGFVLEDFAFGMAFAVLLSVCQPRSLARQPALLFREPMKFGEACALSITTVRPFRF